MVYTGSVLMLSSMWIMNACVTSSMCFDAFGDPRFPIIPSASSTNKMHGRFDSFIAV